MDRLGQVPGFGYDVEIQSVHHIVRWTIRFFIVVCGWQISEVIYAEFSYNRASKNNMYNLVTFRNTYKVKLHLRWTRLYN